MECHRCKNRADVEAGKFARMPFSETPCAKCELKENSEYTMEYDAERGEWTLDSGLSSQRAVCSGQMAEQEEERLPISVMTEVVVELLNLKPEIRDIVCWRFAGMPYRDIAALQGITVAAAEIRHWRAMKKWPALRALFAAKAAKQARRKSVGSRQFSVGRNQ